MKSYLREIKYNLQCVRKVLELNYALLSEFNFPFSKRHNALHGIPSMAAILSGMSLHRACANEASRMTALDAARNVPEEDVADVHTPTSQWALGVIGAIKDPDEMEERCGRVADITVGAMGAAGMIPEAPVGAIDGHNMENYSKRLGEEYTIRSKFKNGTTKFIPALTSVIVSGPYTIHTACRLMRRGRPRAEYIAHLLDDNAGRGVYCSHYLIDREFFNVASMSEFTKRGEHFLMYARMTDGVKKARDQYLAGTRPAVSEYIVKSGRIRFTGTIVFQKKTERGEDGKERTVVLPFFSNLPRPRVEKAVDLLRTELKKRQRIEVGYKSAERCMPMTTSNSPALRTFMFHYSLAVENMWALADHMIEIGSRAGTHRPVITPPPSPIFGLHGWVTKKKYNITNKEFCQLLFSEATKVVVMPKKEQDEYAADAVGEMLRRFSGHAEAASLLAYSRSAKRATAAVAAKPLFSSA